MSSSDANVENNLPDLETPTVALALGTTIDSTITLHQYGLIL